MQISYPSHHSWTKPITENHLELFGESARRKLRTTAKAVAHQAINTKVERLNEKTLEWFIPLYEERMKLKHSPIIFNVKETTLNNPNTKKTYYSLSLFEQGRPIGATIFSLFNQRLSIAYRAYSPQWQHATLPASPSLYTEWAIADFASEQNIKKIIHGKNRNPYGAFASIGLATFKLSSGCVPVTAKKFELKSADTSSFTEDVLILLQPEGGEKQIRSSLLIIAEENFPAHEQITKYPERLQVKVIFRI